MSSGSAPSQHEMIPVPTNSSTIWLDFTDLIDHLARSTTVTGIQRVMLEIYNVIHKNPVVRVCAFDPTRSAFAELASGDVFAVSPHPKRKLSFANRARKTAVSLVPKSIRYRIAPPTSPPLPIENTVAAAFKKGDVFVELGMFWYFAEHPQRIANACANHDMRLALLIHDLIPADHPEWFGIEHSTRWSAQLEYLLRIADCVFANSLSVASRIASFCGERELSPPDVKVLRFGNVGLRRLHAPVSSDKPIPYVLVVGSIDARKNQRSLLTIWSRLIDELGAAKTPQLVLIGKPGVKANEFFSALRSSSKVLRSKVAVLSDIDDRQLADYYAESLFTIFPGLAEGWGLPVEESLAFGKVCIASNGESIREAGGSLACYFDSTDSAEQFRLVKRFIVDVDERVRWENEIRLNFEERNWQEAAHVLLAHLNSVDDR